LKSVPQLQLIPDDLASADTGIRLLKDLIDKVPAVADAVSRSKEVIENTSRQIGKLEFFKTIHDSLHRIEFECLRPMQAGDERSNTRPMKSAFARQASRLLQAMRGTTMEPELCDDLREALDSTGEAFQKVVSSPGKDALQNVVSELNLLLSRFPPQLDGLIAVAAKALDIDRLVELMTQVRGTLPAVSSARDTELAPFIQGIDALQRLRDELTRRVSEHNQLQRLDSELRTARVGGANMGAIASQWRGIKRSRAKLAPPFSAEMGAVNEDWVALELEIESAVERSDKGTLDLLTEYFGSVSSVFRDVDGSLKDFCLRLSVVSQPLQTILAML
jgi:hypothetical protein